MGPADRHHEHLNVRIRNHLDRFDPGSLLERPSREPRSGSRWRRRFAPPLPRDSTRDGFAATGRANPVEIE